MSIKLALCALTLTALAGAASADVIAETGTFHNAGTQTIDLNGNVLSSARGASTTVFSNLQAGYAADRAFSSTDLTSVFGDQLATTGTGRLQEFSFTIFNSGTSAGNLTSATALIQFYRASDGSSIGGFTVNTGTLNLGLGFFTALNVTGLDALNINLDTTDIIVTQSLSNIVGPPTAWAWSPPRRPPLAPPSTSSTSTRPPSVRRRRLLQHHRRRRPRPVQGRPTRSLSPPPARSR
jgi:hypothetical protein